MNHHNQDYSGGIPLAVGDRYYCQDLGRDFWYKINVAGENVASMFNDFPVLFDNPTLSQGSSFHEIDIDAINGICNYEVTVPNSFASIPPTTQLLDVVVQVQLPAQTDFDFQATATLDGATTNYIKLRYAETNGNSRNRAKKSGSYNYEKVPSYSLVIDSVVNTDYDVLLGTLIGDDATFLTIIPAVKTQIKGSGSVILSKTAKENITAGDPVGIDDFTGEAEKIFKDAIAKSFTAPDPGTISEIDVCQLGTTSYFVVTFSLNPGTASDGVYARIGHLNAAGTIVWDTSAVACGTTGISLWGRYLWAKPMGSDRFILTWNDQGVGSICSCSIGYLSGGTILFDVFEDTSLPTNSHEVLTFPDYKVAGDIAFVSFGGPNQVEFDVYYVSGGALVQRSSGALTNVLGTGTTTEFSAAWANNKQEIMICGDRSNAIYIAYVELVGTTTTSLAGPTFIENTVVGLHAVHIGGQQQQNGIIYSKSSVTKIAYCHREGSSVLADHHTDESPNSTEVIGDAGSGINWAGNWQDKIVIDDSWWWTILKARAFGHALSLYDVVLRKNINKLTGAHRAGGYGTNHLVWCDQTTGLDFIKYVKYVGIALNTASTGNQVNIVLKGRMTGLSGLLPNEIYYADYESQSISICPSEHIIGRAISATELEIGT